MRKAISWQIYNKNANITYMTCLFFFAFVVKSLSADIIDEALEVLVLLMRMMSFFSSLFRFIGLTGHFTMHLPDAVMDGACAENFQKGYSLCILEALRFLSAHRMYDEMKYLVKTCLPGEESLTDHTTVDQKLTNHENKLDESVTVYGRPVRNVDILRRIRQKILERRHRRHPLVRRKHSSGDESMWRPW
jgi:hypothetical protein